MTGETAGLWSLGERSILKEPVEDYLFSAALTIDWV
jgi:hypothetical protein